MIKITLLKKKLMKDAAIVLGAVVVAGGCMAWGMATSAGIHEKLDQLKRQSQKAISDAQKEQEEYEATIAAFNRFENIPQHRLPASDYDTIQSRIRALRPVVETLEERYKFSKLDVKISKLDDPVAASNADYLIIKSDLTIEFEGLTDEYVYSFIHALIQDLPGYLYLQELKINKLQPITPVLLQQASASGTSTPLVSGSMMLAWRTIKPVPVAAPEGGSAENSAQNADKPKKSSGKSGGKH